MTVYLDTSAAAKLLVEELESAALASYLDSLDAAEELMSSVLLETELRRLGIRLEIPQATISQLLDQVALVEVSRSLFREAGLLPGSYLRSLDALHIAAALRLDCRLLITYDHRMATAATDVGLATIGPAPS